MKSTAGIILALTLLLAAPAGAANGHAEVSASLNVSALQPGQTAVAAIVIKIAPGLHIQSAFAPKPYIKLEIQMTDNSAVEFLPLVYPPGLDRNFPALGKLNINEGTVIVYLPLRVKTDAPLAATEIAGRLTLQACSDNFCFNPEHPTFTISTTIVPATAAVETQNAELFQNFDPRVFAAAAGSSSPLPPAATAPEAENIEFFGHGFSLSLTWHALALVLAFGVGILFNLVPCVLPVLPLKAIGFYEVSQHNRARCLFLGLVFSAGVVSVFVGLAALLLGVGGLPHLAWGEQFKYGWFVWPLVVILVVMSVGMFGLFDIVVPQSIYQISPRHDSIAGNYLFGILTAVLSTPCTAPMFPGILAWALKQPSKTLGALTIIMVGVGMAAPYLVLSAFPGLAKKIPRAGPWSLVVKQMMGFLVLAVAVYFAGGKIFSGSDFWWAVFAVIAAMALFLVIRTLQLARRLIPLTVTTIIAILIVAGALGLTRALTSGGLEWTPYSPQALSDARNTGQLVLLEFTARWCANCQTLEATVFHDPRAQSAISHHRVTLLRADLTNEDASGWAALKDLNPSGGIPLTAIYVPGHSEPITLSSLYTTQNLVDALDRAGP